MPVPISRLPAIILLPSAPIIFALVVGDTSIFEQAIGTMLLLAGLFCTKPNNSLRDSTLLLFCFFGMTIGMLIDKRSVMLVSVADLCFTSSSVIESVLRHWTILPATNLLMLAGSPIAIAVSCLDVALRRRTTIHNLMWRRVGLALVCDLTMVVASATTVSLGFVAARSIGLHWTTSGMMTLMLAGMIWATAAVRFLRAPFWSKSSDINIRRESIARYGT